MKTNKEEAKGSRYTSKQTENWSNYCFQQRHEDKNQKYTCKGYMHREGKRVPCECPCHDITEYIVPAGNIGNVNQYL